MKLRALGGHILVKPSESRRRVGSIHLPDTGQIEQRIGTVVEAGPGMWRGTSFVPMELKPGDKVIYGQYSGQRLTFTREVLSPDGKPDRVETEVLIHMKEEDAYAVIVEENEIVSVEDFLGY